MSGRPDSARRSAPGGGSAQPVTAGSVQVRVLRQRGEHGQRGRLAAQDLAPQPLGAVAEQVAVAGPVRRASCPRRSRRRAGRRPSRRTRRRRAARLSRPRKSSGELSRSTSPSEPVDLAPAEGASSTRSAIPSDPRARAALSSTGPPRKNTPGSLTTSRHGVEHLADRGLGGLVEDHAQAAVLVGVQDEQHAAREVGVDQRRGGDQQGAWRGLHALHGGTRILDRKRLRPRCRVSSAVAMAASPSPRPVRPRPSVVVALIETSMPCRSATPRSASSRRGPNRGPVADQLAGDVADLPAGVRAPGAASRRAGRRRRRRPTAAPTYRSCCRGPRARRRRAARRRSRAARRRRRSGPRGPLPPPANPVRPPASNDLVPGGGRRCRCRCAGSRGRSCPDRCAGVGRS